MKAYSWALGLLAGLALVAAILFTLWCFVSTEQVFASYEWAGTGEPSRGLRTEDGNRPKRVFSPTDFAAQIDDLYVLDPGGNHHEVTATDQVKAELGKKKWMKVMVEQPALTEVRFRAPDGTILETRWHAEDREVSFSDEAVRAQTGELDLSQPVIDVYAVPKRPIRLLAPSFTSPQDHDFDEYMTQYEWTKEISGTTTNWVRTGFPFDEVTHFEISEALPVPVWSDRPSNILTTGSMSEEREQARRKPHPGWKGIVYWPDGKPAQDIELSAWVFGLMEDGPPAKAHCNTSSLRDGRFHLKPPASIRHIGASIRIEFKGPTFSMEIWVNAEHDNVIVLHDKTATRSFRSGSQAQSVQGRPGEPLKETWSDSIPGLTFKEIPQNFSMVNLELLDLGVPPDDEFDALDELLGGHNPKDQPSSAEQPALAIPPPSTNRAPTRVQVLDASGAPTAGVSCYAQYGENLLVASGPEGWLQLGRFPGRLQLQCWRELLHVKVDLPDSRLTAFEWYPPVEFGEREGDQKIRPVAPAWIRASIPLGDHAIENSIRFSTDRHEEEYEAEDHHEWVVKRKGDTLHIVAGPFRAGPIKTSVRIDESKNGIDGVRHWKSRIEIKAGRVHTLPSGKSTWHRSQAVPFRVLDAGRPAFQALLNEEVRCDVNGNARVELRTNTRDEPFVSAKAWGADLPEIIYINDLLSEEFELSLSPRHKVQLQATGTLDETMRIVVQSLEEAIAKPAAIQGPTGAQAFALTLPPGTYRATVHQNERKPGTTTFVVPADSSVRLELP